MGLIRWIKRFFSSGDIPINIEEVESSIGYHFSDPNYLFKSLKHRSYSQAVYGNTNLSNERLEFLGDSVLNMIVSHYVFSNNLEMQEGDLTKRRSSYVNKQSAMLAAKRIGLDKHILLNDSEENAGGRHRTSIIGDCFEAVIGAIFLDGGYQSAESFVYRTILDDNAGYLDVEQRNFKSHLLEKVQAEKLGHPVYRTVSENGPDHDKEFRVEVFLGGRSIGSGSGKSKKTAQQMAAKEGLETLNDLEHQKKRVPVEESNK